MVAYNLTKMTIKGFLITLTIGFCPKKKIFIHFLASHFSWFQRYSWMLYNNNISNSENNELLYFEIFNKYSSKQMKMIIIINLEWLKVFKALSCIAFSLHRQRAKTNLFICALSRLCEIGDEKKNGVDHLRDICDAGLLFWCEPETFVEFQFAIIAGL